MSGKPSSKTDKAIEWLKEEKVRTLKEALDLFKVSRISVLVQLGQEWLRAHKSQ